MTLPLVPEHLRHGARMTDFHGYELPLTFSSILEESRAVREAAGLFDISHMGHFIVRGPGARQAINRLMTSDLEAVPFGKSLYGILPDSNGGAVDDLIACAFDPETVHIIVNAGTREGDYAYIRERLSPGIHLEDQSPGQVALALQGPKSPDIVRLLGQGFESMLRREVRQLPAEGGLLWVSRTGYTGEDGWEFFGPAPRVLDFYRVLSTEGMAHGLAMAGLGARDLLRLEMGYSLYGQELTRERTPFDAGLDFAVNLRKGEFLGRESMMAARNDRNRERLSGFTLLDRGIPRTHCPVLDPETGQRVGEVTSGGHSPRVGGGFGLAYLSGLFWEKFQHSAEAVVEIHGKHHRARMHPRPFIKVSPHSTTPGL